MTIAALIQRNLRHFRRSHLAVIAGVATAVAVLAGALLVGHSVRASLRRLALERIGNAEAVVRSTALFREALAAQFTGAAPMIALEGVVSEQSSGRRASGVAVYGVDDRFWKLHGQPSPGLAGRDAALSPALAAELDAAPGATIVLRMEKFTDIPAESLFGRKEAAGASVRFAVKEVLAANRMGEFSLRPSQAAVKALFVPLARLQKEMNAAARINAILTARGPGAPPAEILRSTFSLDDLGIRVKALPDRGQVQMETASGVIADPLAAAMRTAAEGAGLQPIPAFTYMATSMKAGGREVPYSLVGAVDLAALGVAQAPDNAIVLGQWAAQDLGARPGDALDMEYMLWHSDGRISREKAAFVVAAIVPMQGLSADRDLTPEYPGITDAANVADWDPPFPMDLSRIRPKDEDYWDRYRTTPKAWLPIARARQLWASRWGSVTAFRMALSRPRGEEVDRVQNDLRVRLRKALDPLAHGFQVVPLREQSLTASRGATDFGEYFSYFSFFLMASALLLAGLFFRLGVEQRFNEIGLLRATGFDATRIRNLFLAEGALLAAAGALVGVLGAVAYAAAVLFGLGTWWVDAVGTRELKLSLAAAPLAGGAFGAMAAALAAIYRTLGALRGVSPRRLLAGGDPAAGYAPVLESRRAARIALIAGALAVLLPALSLAGVIPAAGGFFGTGFLMLAAALAAWRARLAGALSRRVTTAAALARRNAGYRPGRTILAAALIASATFLLVSVEAFRRNPHMDTRDPKSGTGGYALMAESVRPLYYNPATAEGRRELGLPDLPGVSFVSFRLRPGDDTSCLNLYEPQNPRILGVPAAFSRLGRFAFAAAEEKAANPWLLLEQNRADGAIPAIADANSLQYVLHRKLGDEIALGAAPGAPRLRIVATLSDSVFQSELLIGESAFLKLFPSQQGHRVFLLETPRGQESAVMAQTESALADQGFDAATTADRLAGFHRVENTYLSTFQTLGGLGLLLGTAGLAAVLIRNVLERRRELALLTAVGFSHRALENLVLRENVFVLAAGLAIGVAAALVAIAPALVSRGAHASLAGIAGLLAAVFATGLAAVWLATRSALAGPLAESLKQGN